MADKTLEQLVKPRTVDQHLILFQAGLKGIGIARQTGYGSGDIALDGTPKVKVALQVQIVVGGQVGAATWRYSVDAGANWSSPVETSETAQAVGSTGLTVAFMDGPTGLGVSFIAGDTFTILLSTPGFPVASWQPFSVYRKLAEITSDSNAERDELITNLARSGFAAYATGDWLDLWGESMYRLSRKKGVPLVGKVTLTDIASAGPVPISAGQLYVLSDDGFRYSNTGAWFDPVTGERRTDDAAIPLDGSLVVEVQAEAKGSGYNVAIDTINRSETPIPGVEVSNPVPPVPVEGTTWIITQGTDDESDDSYQLRMFARWPELAEQAKPEEVYRARAIEASSSVTRAYVRPHDTLPGRVHVTLAGPAGAVDPAVVAAVEPELRKIDGICALTLADSAVNDPLTITATVYIRAGYLGAATAACALALNERARAVSLEGDTLYLTQIIEDLMGPEGVYDVDVISPPGDTVFASGHIPALTQDLTFVEES